jgi:orotidine-5'-phosphate decarboxylase
MARPEIAIAYDTEDLESALALDEALAPGEEWAKIGLELFTIAGPAAVEAFKARGRRVFLDLKLHDIPNTVERAAKAAARLGADLLTVHAMGSSEMVAAAVRGAQAGSARARVVAVTVLTSLNQYNLPPGFTRPFHGALVVADLAKAALAAGAAGIVCSGAELATVRFMVKQPFFAVTPGLRAEGEAANDQKRTVTIREAVKSGADLLVIGRPITRAKDPRMALARARAERDAAWGMGQVVGAG